MEDIQTVILENIDDIDDMIKYCKQNKFLMDKCLTREFWIPFFKRHSCNLPNIEIKSIKQIRDLYKICQSHKNKGIQGELKPINLYIYFTDYIPVMIANGIDIDVNEINVNHMIIDSIVIFNKEIIFNGHDADTTLSFELHKSEEKSKIESFIVDLFYNDMVEI